MSLNLNSVVVAGHLTRDPELRLLGGDKTVANFGMATNRTYKDAAGTKVEEVTFLDCEAWGRTADLIGQYLKKGSPAYIEGRLKLESWTDKTDGTKRSKIKIVADRVQFLSTGKPTAALTGTAAAADVDMQAAKVAAARAQTTAPEDEPPF